MLFCDKFFSGLYTDLKNKSNLDNLWIQVTITAVKVFLQILFECKSFYKLQNTLISQDSFKQQDHWKRGK